MTRSDWKAFGFLAAFSTVILFFVSQDSFLYDLHSRVDSAWFFMCGKAWMNGLTPYVDFADSKGPLLWLIYGLGYLIQHTNYLGVFWISCLWYSLTYFISYRIAGIFLKDSRKALACAILLTLVFFNPWFHNEIRAEDLCLLFLNLSLYRVCLLMYFDSVSHRILLSSFAILGFCFGAILMIKFSIAAMQAVFIMCALAVLIKEKKNWWQPFLCGISGFLSITLPFIILFLIKGNLAAFIQEYFVKTLQTVQAVDADWCPGNLLLSTVQTDNPLLTYLLEWGDLIYSPKILVVFATLVLGGLLFMKKAVRYRWMPLVVSVLVFALVIRHHTDYYFTSCSFLFIFLLIEILDSFSRKADRKTVIGAMVAASLIIPFHLLSYSFKVLIFNDNINQRDFYRISYVMSQVDRPTLINAYDYERGFGILSESLPAGKYWTRQNGITPEMRKEHEDLILSGSADFIIIDSNYFEDSELINKQQLLDIGYVEYLHFGSSGNFILFSNKEDLDVPDNATPSLMALFRKGPHLIDRVREQAISQSRTMAPAF